MRRIVQLLLATLVASVVGAAPPEPARSAIDWGAVDHDLAVSAARPTAAPPTSISPRLQKAQEDYEVGVLERRAQAFQWQARASRIIFWMVLSLVAFGVVSSALQFWAALRKGSAAVDQELDISLQGVRLRTQFLGLVTLAFSLAFFYLYLATVYPIFETP